MHPSSRLPLALLVAGMLASAEGWAAEPPAEPAPSPQPQAAPAAAPPAGSEPAPSPQPQAAPAAALPAGAEPAPSPPAAPAAAPAAPHVAGFAVHGAADPADRIDSLVTLVVPPGSYFVEEGEADRVGAPIGTVPRLRQTLGRIGYDAVVEVQARGADVHLDIHLRPLDRLRQIFVSGNGRVRQEEIIRRLSLRPGQALPHIGPERDGLMDTDARQVRDYLWNQGYLEAEVSIELIGTAEVPSRVNMIVRCKLGSPYPIGPITVEGNRAVPTEEIADQFRHLAFWPWLWTRSAPFRQRVLAEDTAKVEEMYRERGYAGVRVLDDFDPRTSIDRQEKHVRLGLKINERKQIEVLFQGVRQRSEADLREVLTLFQRGGGYDDVEVNNSAGAVAAYYRERGHMLVKVRWQRERVSADLERITFIIDEGPVIKVRRVEFAGNQQLPASTLAAAVRTKPYPFLGFLGLGEGGFASLRQLALDVETLIDHYEASGFPEARVTAQMAPAPEQWRPIDRVRPEDEALWRRARNLDVRFTIVEGVRLRVGSIRFEVTDGRSPLPRSESFLRDSLLTRTGTPYRPGLIRQDGGRLRRLLGDEGYPRASVEPLVTRRGDEMHVLWQLALGPAVRVGPVFVRGNFLTRESTIRQWVPLDTGDIVTTTAVERAQRNLALIQLFNNASPLSFPADTPDDPVVPMLIEVEERHDHWGVLRVGGGASTEQRPPGWDFPVGFYASLGYEHRNLFGHGWTLLSQGAYGNSVARANASFLDPRLFGTLFRLEVSANYLQQATVRLGDIRSGGGSVGLSREMYPGLDASLRYNLRNTFRTEFLLRGAGPDEDQQTVQIGTLVGSLGAGVEWLRLDNPLLPTRGFRLSAGAELALPSFSLWFGEDTFLKVHARSIVVVPLLRWLSLRHSLRYDQGFPIGGAPVLPKVERFFAGGDTTIRGFELDRARSEALRAPYAPGVTSVTYRPVGGSLRVLHNIDLQFPIAPPLYGSVFIDSGMVADSFLGLRAYDFRHGAGISPLLVKLPIGDISLSWAWPLDPRAGDSRIGRLHFNVGLMF